jgi:hypothetical protein
VRTLPRCYLSQLHVNAHGSQQRGRGTGAPKERLDRTEFRDSHGAFEYRVGQQAGTYFFEFSSRVQRTDSGAPATGVLRGKRSGGRSCLFGLMATCMK